MACMESDTQPPPTAEALSLATSFLQGPPISITPSAMTQAVLTHPTPDPETIAQFFHGIGAPVHLCTILPDGPCRGQWFGDDIGAAVGWAVTENRAGKKKEYL